jgi:hypothetical protein
MERDYHTKFQGPAMSLLGCRGWDPQIGKSLSSIKGLTVERFHEVKISVNLILMVN